MDLVNWKFEDDDEEDIYEVPQTPEPEVLWAAVSSKLLLQNSPSSCKMCLRDLTDNRVVFHRQNLKYAYLGAK